VVATVTCDTDCSNLSFCATCTPGVCTSCRAYHLLDGSNNCQPICGDGIVLMVENCDDGNLINGDGCSSSCTTETNFECSNAPLKPSLCSLLFFTITLDSIIKDENKNSVAVIYQLSPSTLPGYQSANWSQIIFQQSTLDVNFTSFSYDPVTGLLTVNAAYNQNINNKELVLGFNFPPTAPFDLIPANQTTTTKLVSSNNLSL
jgi:cysteine-rich repeat protein